MGRVRGRGWEGCRFDWAAFTGFRPALREVALHGAALLAVDQHENLGTEHVEKSVGLFEKFPSFECRRPWGEEQQETTK